MSLDFLNGFNPRNTQLLEFLRLTSTVVGSSIMLKPDQMMAVMNFDNGGWRAEPGKQAIEIQHACRLHCELLDGAAVIGRFAVVTPALRML